MDFESFCTLILNPSLVRCSFTLGSWFGRLFLIEGLGSLGWDSANLVNDLLSLFVNEEICLLGLV